jgi:transposase-like protein
MDVTKLTARPTSTKPVRPGVYNCRGCRKQFTVKIGTIFEDSHIPFCKWLMAIHLMTSSKKGVSSLQISREVDVTLKSAWFMTHRIREMMRTDPTDPLNGTVEVDETYVGGKPRPGSKFVAKKGRGTKKAPVVVLVERDGRAVAYPVYRVTSKELKSAVKEMVDESAKIVTDEFTSYRGLDKHFEGGHATINHGRGEYARKETDGFVTHTNTAESFFALLKRGHYGIFHSLSKKHLHRYTTEFSFRWNQRHVSDGERMVEALKGASGRRLMYRPPHWIAG